MASSRQIKELKEILQQRKEELLASIEESQSKLVDLQCNDCKDEYDMAETTSDCYTIEQIILKQKAEIKDIENALKATEDGSYGICQMCDEPIAIGRLKAKPFAKFCTTCRKIYEEENK